MPDCVCSNFVGELIDCILGGDTIQIFDDYWVIAFAKIWTCLIVPVENLLTCIFGERAWGHTIGTFVACYRTGKDHTIVIWCQSGGVLSVLC